MVTIIEAALLGIVQGITEWLPISSSGHLVLVQHFMTINSPVIFDVFLHLGTLLVLFIYFRKQLLDLAFGALRFDKKSIRMIAMILLATIPTALFGYFFKDLLESLFSSMLFTGIGFMITAVWILAARYPKKKDKELGYLHSFFIGCAQAISIVPSISRSGATIATGLLFGVKKEEAANFSFLIAIPAILGAAFLTLKDAALNSIPDAVPMAIGALIAAVVGYLSLSFLMTIIKKDKFYGFAWYCFAIGIFALGLWWLKF